MTKLVNFKSLTIALAAAGASLLSGCSAQPPVRAESARLGCEQLGDAARTDYFAPGHVSGVSRVTRVDHVSRATPVVRTAGADIYLNAQPGMTPAFVERVLSCQAASQQTAQSPIASSAGRVAISVRNDAGRIAVRALGSNRQASEDVWQKARALAQPVDVEQVASLSASTF
jgi:hypothetical protein